MEQLRGGDGCGKDNLVFEIEHELEVKLVYLELVFTQADMGGDGAGIKAEF